MRVSDRKFPQGFLWGAATSGYQVEGAAQADGKGMSIWDRFAHRKGATLHGDHGDRACCTYDPATLEADLDLMAGLGLGAYVFSVQWPRIQPRGRGRANAKGLDYYERLVDGLLARSIVPALTLYHWELPQALQERGGWLNRDTVDRFVDYAALVYDRLASRVPLWITQNEPSTSAWLGHGSGLHAPGLTGDVNALTAAHHLLLSHGRCIRVLRDRAAGAVTRFGPVINLVPFRPAGPSAADAAAARQLDGERNRLFLDALFKSTYPVDVRRRHRQATCDFAFIGDDDMSVIATPSDFLGINYYLSQRVRHRPRAAPEVVAAVGETTAMGWAVDPAGLGEVLRHTRDSYTGELPLIVSENGISCRDYVDPEGRCNDPERIDYLRRHLEEAWRAIEAGVPLKGYFVWSLLDNFEWDSGYRERFGLVHVDYPSQVRTPKRSYDWYRQTIGRNALA